VLAPSRKAAVVSLIILVITSIALWLQLSTYPNHDVAWVLWGAREMLGGAKFGKDIIEPNPPLAWYLSMPTTALAKWLGVPLDWTFRGAVAIVGAVSAASVAWLASDHRSYSSRIALCTIAAVSLLLLPGREFGQREHLLAIAILPYLGVAARRMAGSRVPSPTIQLLVGIIAGVGLALKPYFVCVPVLVEIGLLTLGAQRPRLLRAENVGVAAVFVTYAVWSLAFEQNYLLQVAPLASEIYWSFNLPFPQIIPPLAVQLAVAAPLMIVAGQKRDPLGLVTTLAWSGFAASYLIQQKGYGYHLLPVVVGTFLLLGCVLTNREVSRPMRASAALLALIFASSSFSPVLQWWRINKPGGLRSIEIGRLLKSIDHHATNGRFLVVAVHPYPAFPTAIYTSAQYTSRTNSQWFLPAVVQTRTRAAGDHDNLSIERHAREFILRDLRERPDLVLIDTDSARHTVSSSKFDFLTFYQQDETFRSLWQHYREIEPIGRYRQFVAIPAHAETAPPFRMDSAR
jgi:hypothetical protein